MKRERMIEILAEEYNKRSDSFDKRSTILNIERGAISITCSEVLTSMQRAVDEETARLKQCEAIVRELADVYPLEALDDIQDTARQWVENNPK